MAEKTPGQRSSKIDQILDLLLDALAERQQQRQSAPAPRLPFAPTPRSEPEQRRTALPQAEPKPPSPIPQPVTEPGDKNRERPRTVEPTPAPRLGATATAAPTAPQLGPQARPGPGDKGWEPPPRKPSIQMGRLLGRLAIAIAALVVLINIPVSRYGVSLARILPETSSLIIRDGLVLKGSGPEIYVLQKNRLRWISSMDAFEHLGLGWKDVHIVDDRTLGQFEKGKPIHVLLKCQSSPHIYRLENDQKRWIKDIATFVAEGHVWDDVRFVSCDYLRQIPDGPPIPEDAGPPPSP